jgi:3-oxoacyl-[acyl-carrier-protein] synthase II
MKIPQANRRVVVTGLGAVTPVGNSAAATWEGLAAGRSGIGPITRFDASGCTAQIAGEVEGFEPTAELPQALRPHGDERPEVTQIFNPKDAKKFGRFTHLGVAAAIEAYVDAGLDGNRAQLDANRMGVNLGVGLGGLPEIEATQDTWREQGFRKISPFFIIQIAPNLLAGQVSLLLNLRGPNMAVASACATSGHSLGEAASAIVRGEADVMVAGGAESTVTPLAVGAFARMRALSTRNDDPAGASRPYDVNRDGFVLSEGAVVFVCWRNVNMLSPGGRASMPSWRVTGHRPMPTTCLRCRPEGRDPSAPCGRRSTRQEWHLKKSILYPPMPPPLREEMVRRPRPLPRCLPPIAIVCT